MGRDEIGRNSHSRGLGTSVTKSNQIWSSGEYKPI